MKPLKPSMREKKRYLLVRGKNLKKNIEKAIIEFVGIRGMSKTGLSFVKDDVISINRESLNDVRASFAVFPDRIHVTRVSGTLRGLGKI